MKGRYQGKVHLVSHAGGSSSLCGLWGVSNVSVLEVLKVTCKRCRVWPGRAWQGSKTRKQKGKVRIDLYQNGDQVEARAEVGRPSPFVQIEPTAQAAVFLLCQWLCGEGYDLRDLNFDPEVKTWKHEGQ